MEEHNPEVETVDLSELVLDVDQITLGQMAAVEQASGRDFMDLVNAGSATQVLVALYLNELQNSEKPRSWKELANRRPLASQSSSSPSPRVGRRPRSVA